MKKKITPIAPPRAVSRAPKAATRKAAVTPRRATATTPAPSAPTAAADAATHETLIGIRAAIEELQSTVARLVTPPTRADNVVEDGVDSLRRLISDLLERRLESVVKEVAGIRAVLPGAGAAVPPGALERIDGLLRDLGAVTFEAAPMDYFDPLIHLQVAEANQADKPDGVVLQTVRPGCRAARGTVVAKACVTVNRRS